MARSLRDALITGVVTEAEVSFPRPVTLEEAQRIATHYGVDVARIDGTNAVFKLKPETEPDLPASMPGSWRVVSCPTCGKFICKATPGSTVQVLCNRCKTESVTAVAA
jgi:hypothetical protein